MQQKGKNNVDLYDFTNVLLIFNKS